METPKTSELDALLNCPEEQIEDYIDGNFALTSRLRKLLLEVRQRVKLAPPKNAAPEPKRTKEIEIDLGGFKFTVRG